MSGLPEKRASERIRRAGATDMLERRGIHVGVAGSTFPSVARLLGELAPELGFNYVILQIDGNFAYASHPEAAEADAIGAEEARRLAGLARERGIRLVPMYNCLGHQSWKERVGALLRSHPEFNEAPDLDPAAEDFYCMSWCPNHPEVHPLAFDLFDELLEAFEADCFHVGMDEVFVLGHCPRCRGKSNAELFAGAVNDYHAHLVGKRGVEMQMWGDRLLDARATGYSEWDASMNETHPAVDQIPTDIVICDWHYRLREDYPSIPFFREKGFRIWPAGWNDAEAVAGLIEAARREGGPAMLGYLATTWTSVSSVVAALGERGSAIADEKVAAIVEGIRVGARLGQA
jgi:hypothetical protein